MFVSLFGAPQTRAYAVNTQQGISNFAKKVSLFALGLFAIVAVSSLPKAEASYGDCMRNCIRSGTNPVICSLICMLVR